MRRLVLSCLLALLLPLLQFAPVSADVNDFTVTDFTADYYLGNADRQGSLDIKEAITVNFTDNNHGILRALPEKYNGQPLHIHIKSIRRDGSTEAYSTYESNGNEVLKIGNADKTVTGSHKYTVDYSVENVMRFNESSNDLIWNVNGTGWEQPFTQVTAYLHVPARLAGKQTDPLCYTGVNGSNSHDCLVANDASTTTYSTTRALAAGENLTFSASFPKGSFTSPTAADWWADHMVQILEIAVLPMITLAGSFLYWRRNGKDLRGRGTIIPEYTPPDGLRPAEADVINRYKLSTKAISATIIDLAIRKYLKITEGMSSGVLGIGKHKEYSLEKLPAPVKDTLHPYEQTILDGLFTSGNKVQLKDLSKKFYMTSQSIQKSIPASLTTDGYFPGNPKKVGNGMYIFGFLTGVAGFTLLGIAAYFGVGLLISSVVLFGFAALMPRRTQKGVEAKEALEGLKMYMNVAEKDRIAILQSPDAPYAPKSAEPVKTVELFEKLLPFAMILGVENEWAKQFEDIYTTPPDWYGGNWSTFNSVYLVSSLNSSMSAMNATFAPPSSSGSGSGGGFSGGGGGGGGGGGW